MSDEETQETSEAIVALEQIEIPFLDESLHALRGSDGEMYIPFVPFCTYLGVGDPQRQMARIRSDETLRDGLRLVEVSTEDGRQRLQSLRVDLLMLWLASMQESRVNEHTHLALSRYKR